MSVDGLQKLLSDIAPSLPDGVHVGLADPAAAPDGLYAVERAAVIRARATRQGEFAAGRRAARAAMRQAGWTDTAIPTQEDRSPVWPKGLTGSISHTRTAALAVVSADADVLLGVDIEDDMPLDDALIGEIAVEDELFLGPDRPCAARRAFSAKEAAYKAQFPVTRTIFGFDGLRLRPDAKRSALACFTADVPPYARGSALPVRQWTGHGMVLSLCVLNAPTFAAVRIGP